MIVWIDTETTGLDYKKEALLEIAVLITDDELNEVGSYSTIIKTPNRKLRRMDNYVTEMHTRSGLLDDLEHFGGRNIKVAEMEILALLDQHGLGKGLLLGGNSVHFDRRMLETRMPRLMARFTHQNLDVSSIGLTIKRWAPHVYDLVKLESKGREHANPHRALSDLIDCVHSLRRYRHLTFTTASEEYLIATRGYAEDTTGEVN